MYAFSYTAGQARGNHIFNDSTIFFSSIFSLEYINYKYVYDVRHFSIKRFYYKLHFAM